VSEFEPSSVGSTPDLTHIHDDDLAGPARDERPPREGLPRSYRMRADSHYVEQLEARRPETSLRFLPTRQIETPPLSSAGLTALIDSVAAHGVLQPLLVRRHGGRYQLIGGRKRLAAALAAGVTEVPCLVRDVAEAEASALAEADNLRPAPEPAIPPVDTECLQEALQALSYDLAGMGALVAYLRPPSASIFKHQATAHLLQAQAWRAAWLAGAASLVAHPYRPGRTRPVAAILERVRSGFEAEARLTPLHLEVTVSPEVAGVTFDENLGSALAGLLFASLVWVQGADEPRVEVRADGPGPRSLRFQIVQRLAPAPEAVMRQLRGPRGSRLPDLITTMGLLAARTVAEYYRGSIEATSAGQRGCVLQALLRKPALDEPE
jgi:hypothetical protein